MALTPLSLQRYHETHLSGKFLSWFHYATNDTSAEVQASGYFNAAAELLKVGDVIQAVVDADGTPAYVQLRVSANTGSAVTVATLS